jgi:hypothetical protein
VPAVERPNEETVHALLETVKDLLRSEEARATSLNTRGSGLAGFIGIIVSLSVTVGRDVLSADMALSARLVAIVVFVAALGVLVASVIIVVVRVLAPVSYRNIAMSEISRYALPEFVQQEKVMVEGRTMRGLIDALASERDRNDRKARSLGRAYNLLVAALCLVAGEAIILALDAAKIL